MKQMRVGARVLKRCARCSKPCYGEFCAVHKRSRARLCVTAADVPLVLEWARAKRIEDDIQAYSARKKVSA